MNVIGLFMSCNEKKNQSRNIIFVVLVFLFVLNANTTNPLLIVFLLDAVFFMRLHSISYARFQPFFWSCIQYKKGVVVFST